MALSPVRRGREALARRRKNRRLAGGPIEPADVDQRLSAVAVEVRAGRFFETTWHLFRVTYFPALTDEETAAVLGEWCFRQGIEPALREGKAELGGKVFDVIYLLLTPK